MRPPTKNNAQYHQYSCVTDIELAEKFDEWFYNQPEEIRAVAMGDVMMLKSKLYQVGDTGAKATLMRLYVEIREEMIAEAKP